MSKKHIFLNVLIVLLSFIIQYNSEFSIKAINATPMFSLGFIIVISMFSSELSSFFWGLIIGIINDSASVSGFGFNSVVFPLICLAVSLLVHYLFNNNILSSGVLSAVFSFAYFTARFCVFYHSVGLKDMLTYLIRTAMPSAIVTAVFSMLVYLIQKRALKGKQISR